MILIRLSSTITKKLFILKDLRSFSGPFLRWFWGSTKTMLLPDVSKTERITEHDCDEREAKAFTAETQRTRRHPGGRVRLSVLEWLPLDSKLHLLEASEWA